MGDFRLLNFSTHPGTPPPRSHWCTGYSSAPLRTVALPSVRRGTGNPDDSNILLAVPRTALDRTGWPSRRTWGNGEPFATIRNGAQGHAALDDNSSIQVHCALQQVPDGGLFCYHPAQRHHLGGSDIHTVRMSGHT